jgi:hypothetical protein
LYSDNSIDGLEVDVDFVPPCRCQDQCMRRTLFRDEQADETTPLFRVHVQISSRRENIFASAMKLGA